MAFGQDNRQNAARKPGDAPAKKGYASGPQNKACGRCKGVHVECTKCPNEVATDDKSFDVGKMAKEMRPCFYHQPGNNYACNGMGHFVCHHVGFLSAEAKAANDKARANRPNKGGGKGGDKRNRPAQRLDFAVEEEEAAQAEERPSASERLLQPS